MRRTTTNGHIICVGCRLTSTGQGDAPAPMLDPGAITTSLPRGCCWCGAESFEYQVGVSGPAELSCLGLHVPDSVEDALREFRRAS